MHFRKVRNVFCKFATKLSKLDRIFLSNQFTSVWPNSHLIVLQKGISDHFPIILKTHSGDYGPYPFKFFNSWLLHDDLPNIVSQTWSLPSLHNRPNIGPASPRLSATIRLNTRCRHPSVTLKLKLQTLKNNVKAWRNSVVLKNTIAIQELKAKVESFDIKAENNGLDGRDIVERLPALKKIKDMEHLNNMDLMEKAKIKWAIEGDENSKFFHGMINSKLAKSRINEIQINGTWVSDPPSVITHIFNSYKHRFEDDSPTRPRFTRNLFKTVMRPIRDGL